MRKKYYLKLALSVAAAALLSACGSTTKDETPWENLVTTGLEGWSTKGGDAPYRMEDSVIIGTAVHDSPNTFLTTNKTYGDFIMEVEFKVHPTMNSGIQIRSNSHEWYRNGQVHGYQIEIDPSDRAWTGGIYDEGRRRWLVPLENNPQAQEAYKQNQWNKFRIEAIGDTIKTWINGVPASHLIDDMTSEGFIGLQVHSISRDAEAGIEAMWRNLNIMTENLNQHSQDTPLEPVITKNQLTFEEQREGWKLLWDGETTEGWRGARLDDFPQQGWVLEDGNLIVLASGGEESAAG